ncbi:alanine--tRNA ligase [Candidatus Magnetomonas plexicatena]|uniref:alanine--tRNA ligase n=1 Tax=Candidatus Magnetomonas plexicatena TaxID=2552947 RepID=UPI001C744B1A|nr:alanine--tRNA ligase [Nitrospirales bacterium LBB_01]
MTGKEIRESFLEFFRKKNHEVVSPSSLIPKSDPTLLFTNAGMVQFKSIFQGLEKLPFSRAASCQKCLRAGGKQSDIENVGFTARHHTFFEMLGNFSFGDYFKKDAIVFAWELLTEWYKLPVDKLWVSIYEDDDEAGELWTEHTGISKDRVVRLGAKDNFWQMGDSGPCGPCSEIIIDLGPHRSCGKPECALGCDCDRYLELWNLVFMQYDRGLDGSLSPLPSPSIDTGMGLERISSVLQGKETNFDTDLFTPIIEAVSSLTGVSYRADKKQDTSIKVMADHMRSVTFLLTEGLMPSNEGRGYVLRRIIRRASRHAHLLGVTEPFLHKLVNSVDEAMGDIYPEITREKERAQDILKFEEERFIKTLEKGTEILDGLIETLKAAGEDTIPGEEIFKLYDTFGFPPDLTADIARENGLKTDDTGFSEEMDKQKKRGRISWTEDTGGGLSALVSSIYNDAVRIDGGSSFLGYDILETKSRVNLIIKDGESVSELSKGEEGDLILDTTPFYGESGGQVGDIGVIFNDTVKIEVKETKKTQDNLTVHKVMVKKGTLAVSDDVSCKVDKKHRHAAMRNHTATHLLHASLKNILGDHIKQAGSLVSPSRLRFDFTHFYPVTAEERHKIEESVNEEIIANHKVLTQTMGLDDAISYGATALFDEKYGDTVRVVEVEGGFSKELCGGTHCRATGEIGLFVILSEGSIASGVRRIEAITGHYALEYLNSKAAQLRAISEILRTDSPLERVTALTTHVKELEKELDSLKIKSLTDNLSSLMENVKVINGIKTLALKKDGLDRKALREFADTLKEQLGSAVLVLASELDGQASLLSMVTKDLTKKYHAGKILKAIAEKANGSGGGNAEMAQGGTKDVNLVTSALNTLPEILSSH